MLNGYVELYIVQVFDGSDCGWSYASELAVAMQKCQAWGAKVVSMSLGGPDKTTAEDNQINSMYKAGMLVFAAAGNGGGSELSYPAGYANAISIAAVNDHNARADFSQFNSDVELAAPGVHVLSTIPISVAPPNLSLAVTGGITLDLTGAKLGLVEGSPVKAFKGLPSACTTKACPASTGMDCATHVSHSLTLSYREPSACADVGCLQPCCLLLELICC